MRMSEHGLSVRGPHFRQDVKAQKVFVKGVKGVACPQGVVWLKNA